MEGSVDVSIVFSVFNEECSLPLLWKETLPILIGLDKSFEVIFVNDGSSDSSEKVIDSILSENNFVKKISFSRNFGHEAAMIAGIDFARGENIICLDADLQHPPSLFSEMLSKASDNYDVVLMKRKTREDANWFKELLGGLFYWGLNKMSPVSFESNASDFFLINRKVANVLRSDFRERKRFLRGFIQMLGFNQSYLEYNAPARVEGESKYNFKNLFSFSIETITSFSKIPLRIGLFFGLISGLISILLSIYSLVMYMAGGTPPGYSTLIIAITFLFSIQFVLIGIIGLYIGYLFDEVKKRPIYTLKNEIG